MAKLIFEYAEILDASGSPIGTPEYIKEIIVDGVEISLDPDSMNVEDNREIFESYTGRIVVRTRNTNFSQVGGSGSTGAILSSAYVSNDGTTHTEGRIRLHGKTGSHDVTTATTYIQGHNDFSNGRLETVLVAQASDVNGSTALAVSTPA